MNEPASMCRFPCRDPEAEAKRLGMPPDPPPIRDPPRPLPGFNISGPQTHPAANATLIGSPVAWGLELGKGSTCPKALFQTQTHARGETRLPDEDVISPPYKIHNGGPSGELSDLTVPTNVVHANGLLEYDIHNLYGTSKGTRTDPFS